MDPQLAIDLSRNAIQTSIYVGGPLLLVILGIGILINVVQAMTQLHDQAISIVPKILVLLLTIAVFLPLLSRPLLEFAETSFGKPAWINHYPSEPQDTSYRPLVNKNDTPTDGPAVIRQASKPQVLQENEDDQKELRSRFESPFTLPNYRYQPRDESISATDQEG